MKKREKKNKEAKVLQRLIQAVCCIGGIKTPKLILVKEIGGFTARASKSTIEINLSSELLAGCTPEEGALLKMGLAAHEVGHHLYTDFNKASNSVLMIDVLKDVEMMNEEWYRDNFNSLFQKMYPSHKLQAHNVIEDAYIEEALMTFLPKSPMVMALKKTRQKAFLNSPTIRELEALKETEREKAYVSLILSYATSGRIRVEEKSEYDLPIYKEIKEIFPLVDRAIEGYDTIDRFRKALTVWTWLFSRDLINIDNPTSGLPEKSNSGTEGNNKQSVSRSQGKSTSSSKEDASGSSEKQSQSSTSEEGQEGEPPESSSAVNEEGEEKEKASSSEDPESEAPEGETEERQEQSDPEEEDGEDGFVSGEESDPDEQEEEESGSSSESDSEESMPNNLPSQEPEKGGVGDSGQYDEEEPEENEDLGNKIREMLEEDDEEDEDEDVDEDEGSIQRISATERPKEDIHKGISCIENRIGQKPSDWERYRQIKPNIDKLVMRSYRPLEKAVKEYLTGSVRNGLYYGNRLNGKGLYRKDMRYFQDKKREEKDLNTVVSVLVDESGSMCGNKNEAAIAMSLVLSTLMEKLNVPCAVYGHHTTGWEDVTVDVYQEFGKTRSGAIMNMQASGCNRDGYALRIVGNRLLQRPEEKKVLVLVCDGQPAHNGYSGEQAYADLRAYQKELKRKGVNLIVAAIDDDKEQIKMIYGSSFMSISNLNRLAELLASRLIRITGMDQI